MKCVSSGLKGKKKKRKYCDQITATMMAMIGPAKEPTYSGSITWNKAPVVKEQHELSDKDNDQLHNTWFAYIWVKEAVGYFWSPTTRMGNVRFTVTDKGGGKLYDLRNENLHLEGLEL